MRRLITIPMSHYCDRARWALELAGLDYVEDAHIQGFHWLATRRAAGTRYVPVLVDGEQVFSDSEDIVEYAAEHAPLFPEDSERRAEAKRMSVEFAGPFGVATRQWIYPRVFQNSHLIASHGGYGASRAQLWGFRCLRPLAQSYIRRRLSLDNEGQREAEQSIAKTLAEVELRMSDGRPYLGGDTFTAADLTFAAMAAPLVMPENYGIPLPGPSDFDAQTEREILAFRERPAGQFALRLYAGHRRPRRE